MSSKILAYNTAKGGFDYVACDANGKMMVSIDANTITINDEDLLAQLTASNVVAEECRTQLVASNVVAEATRSQVVAQLQSAMSVHGATLVQLQDIYTSSESSRVQLVASNTVIQSVKTSVDATNTLLALPLTVKRAQLGSMYNVANDTSLASGASTTPFDVSTYGWISGFYKDASTSTYDGIRVEYSFDSSTWINGANDIMPMSSGGFRNGFIYKTDVPAINWIKFTNKSSTDTLSNVHISLTGASF